MVLMLQGLEMMRYKNLVASTQLSNPGSFLERQPSLRASGKVSFWNLDGYCSKRTSIKISRQFLDIADLL